MNLSGYQPIGTIQFLELSGTEKKKIDYITEIGQNPALVIIQNNTVPGSTSFDGADIVRYTFDDNPGAFDTDSKSLVLKAFDNITVIGSDNITKMVFWKENVPEDMNMMVQCFAISK